MEEHQRRRRDLEPREHALAGQERQLAQVDRQAELARLALSMEEFCRRVSQGLKQASWEQKRQLIEWLVARVVVTDGEVEIRYVIPTSPAGEAAHFCHLRSNYRTPDQPPEAVPPYRDPLREAWRQLPGHGHARHDPALAMTTVCRHALPLPGHFQIRGWLEAVFAAGAPHGWGEWGEQPVDDGAAHCGQAWRWWRPRNVGAHLPPAPSGSVRRGAGAASRHGRCRPSGRAGASLSRTDPRSGPAQLALELLVRLLAHPARLDGSGQRTHRRAERQVAEVAFALAR